MIKFKHNANTDELLDSYARYYHTPSQCNLFKLYNSIIGYNFDDYNKFTKKILQISQNDQPDRINLYTNTRTPYQFGPNPYNLLTLFENFLRYKHLSTEPKKLLSVSDESTLAASAKRSFETSYRANNLFLHLDELRQAANNKIIIGKAASINQIQTATDYAVNSDVPCFVKQTSTYINDQMINWVTGLNFWTCPARHKHFLPIFHKENHYVNLLNFGKTPRPIDDAFEIKSDFFKCSCGRYRCEFDFTPHVANFPDNCNYRDLLNLASQIEDTRWIQFIFDKELFVYYKPHIEELSVNSINLIENAFNEHAIIIKDKTYPVGQKLPAFWKLTN